MQRKYTISQRLKEIISLKRIKQVDILNAAKPLCEKSKIKLGSNDLSQYVTGKVEPSFKKLSILAKALNVNEIWLMGYDIPMKANIELTEKNIINNIYEDFELFYDRNSYILDIFDKETIKKIINKKVNEKTNF